LRFVVKVLGTITDAQESELLAVEELWPDVPHQVCQFHVLRDASTTAFEADKALKTAMRNRLQPKVREVRKQIKKHLATASPQEAEQLAVLDDYATGILTALNTDGLQPFKYATGEASQMLEQIAASLRHLPKKGGPVSRLCAQKLARLQTIVAERADWAEPLAQVKRLHGWLLEVEHVLDRSRAREGEVVTKVTVGIGLDHWRERMSGQLTDGSLSQLEQECLTEFLQVRVLLALAPGAVLRSGRLSAYQQ
jgi:hypothetical protein